MKNYQYLPLDKQAEKLIEILLMSRSINSILETAHTLDLPNWYLGAGCIPQTVWNYLTGKKLEDSISDYDLVYYDGSDLSKEKEEERLEETRDLLEYQGMKRIMVIRLSNTIVLKMQYLHGPRLQHQLE